MANQGKRMVPEYLIKKIGEGGGGTEYTAGTGIEITGSTISVDTETVAMKSDLATVATTGAYSDLTGTPTIPVVSANTGATPTATLTDLNVDGTVYGVSGGGSVDIDEQTIIEDSVTGKIKTAVGGWKETVVPSVQLDWTLSSGGSDWDYTSSDYSDTSMKDLFDNLDINVEYDVTLTFTGTTVPANITRAYIKTSSKTSQKFGDGSTLHIVDENNNTHTWEFYIEDGGYYWKMHVWPADGWVSPTPGSTLEILFDQIEKTTYHTIEVNFLPDVTSKIKTTQTLEVNPNNELGVNTDNSGSVRFSQSSGLRADVNTYKDILVGQDNSGYRAIRTTYGGGYKSEIIIPLSDLTYDSTNNVYELTNQDLLNKLVNVFANVKKDDMDWSCAIQVRGVDSNDYNLYNRVMYLNCDVTDEGGTLYLYKDSLTSPTAMAFKFSIADQTNYTPTGAYEKIVFQSGADLQYIRINFNSPETIEYMDFVEPIDPKFIPGISETPTVAGTYTLQATVDAQGNVTYTWVAVQP